MQLCLIRKVLQHLTPIFYSARSQRIFFQAEWSPWKRNVELRRFHEWKPWLIFHMKRLTATITEMRSIKALEMKDNVRRWTEQVCVCVSFQLLQGECHENMPCSPQKQHYTHTDYFMTNKPPFLISAIMISFILH